MAEVHDVSDERLTSQAAASVADADDDVEKETRAFLEVLEWSISHTENAYDITSHSAKHPASRSRKAVKRESLPMVSVTATRSKRQCRSMIVSAEAEAESEDEIEGPLPVSVERGASDQQGDESLREIGEKLRKLADDLDQDYVRKEQTKIAEVKEYEDFASTVSIAIGNDPSVQKVAMFFKLTRDVITAAASEQSRNEVMNWTAQFYRENMAPWVAKNNGLVSFIGASRD